jgi:hypothetical protein
VTFSIPEPNPFERATANATLAAQMARTEPEKAKAKFLAAQRRGTLDPNLAAAEAALFPAKAVDKYAWVDDIPERN